MSEVILSTTTGSLEGCDILNGHMQMHYGNSEPAITWPFQEWGDTGNNLWKQRNQNNSAWIERGVLDAENFGFIDTSYLISYVDSKRQEDDPIGLIKPILSINATTNHVLLDGKTIGDASSGANLADNTTILLFNWLWTNLNNTTGPILTSAGAASTRGATAADDWAAHKRITLPDARGRILVGLDSLGGTSGGIIAGTWADSIGGIGGTETQALTTANLPAHKHLANDYYPDPTSIADTGNGTVSAGSGNRHTGADSGARIKVYTEDTGSGTAHNNLQPSMAIGYQMRYKY